MQSPEAEMVSRMLGIKDFFILLGGSIVGHLIGSVDTLGALNMAIGIPVGAFGSTKYVKPLWAKEFLMGLGIGFTTAGLTQFTEPLADWIDDQAGTKGYTTIRRSFENTIRTLSGAGITITTETEPTLEGTGYSF